MSDNFFMLVAIFTAVIEIIAIICALHAVMNTRSSQGAIAWSISLITFPFLTLPLYAIFGRRKFQGYVDARRTGDLEIHQITRKLAEAYENNDWQLFGENATTCRTFERLARIPFVGYNNLQLLIDGEATFEAIFRSIESAQKYILIQFYIVKNDGLGNELKSRLINKAKQGVAVYFLYDEIGSHALAPDYVTQLKNAGVEVYSFNSTQGRTNRFQINFRNHRKIVIVDGDTAFIGGHNVGDEYLGLHPKLSPWRDTHVEISGLATIAIQIVFLEDWYWASRRVPELDWSPSIDSAMDQKVLVVPTGPADETDTCALTFIHAINSATVRCWIVSPYFVPDEAIISALQLAAARGVDVRILIPEKPDHKVVYLASFSYFKETIGAGVKLYRYQKGFLHQKVILVDEEVAGVGTANLDNRSLRLNFEVTMIAVDKKFNSEVEHMLLEDFSNSRMIELSDVENRSIFFRAAVNVSRLLSPIL